jgi:hypothetical protein
MGRPRQGLKDPIRENLEALAHAYRHLHNEVERSQPESSQRRVLEERLTGVRERFDRLLGEWVADEQVRAQWSEYLHTHGPMPAEPQAVDPVVFRGENDAGSFCEVRRGRDGLDVRVDGSLLERIEAKEELESRTPGLVLRVDGFEFREVFRAPVPAIEALSAFSADGGAPPWEHATELLEDGEIGTRFDLTPRGRRAVG